KGIYSWQQALSLGGGTNSPFLFILNIQFTLNRISISKILGAGGEGSWVLARTFNTETQTFLLLEEESNRLKYLEIDFPGMKRPSFLYYPKLVSNPTMRLS
ncbi:MAG: hypothetical protein ACK481_00685, partial [Candidatus Melainabacteria bacterium]